MLALDSASCLGTDLNLPEILGRVHSFVNECRPPRICDANGDHTPEFMDMYAKLRKLPIPWGDLKTLGMRPTMSRSELGARIELLCRGNQANFPSLFSLLILINAHRGLPYGE